MLLPHEPHWYTAMESNEQEVYEMLRWFDKYVKNAGSQRQHGGRPVSEEEVEVYKDGSVSATGDLASVDEREIIFRSPFRKAFKLLADQNAVVCRRSFSCSSFLFLFLIRLDRRA